MKYLLSLLALVAGVFGSNDAAKAQAVVLCDNCVEQAQFEAAAEIRHGEMRGYGHYLVVNDNTGGSAWVETSYTPPGEVPMSVPAPVKNGSEVSMPEAVMNVHRSGISARVISPAIHVPKARAPNSLENGAMGLGDNVTTSRGSSEGERLQIEAIIKILKHEIFVHPDPSTGPFSSFQEGRDQIRSVEAAIEIAHTAQNPAWKNNYISPNVVKSLFQSIETLRGKGPRGCVLFGNGDVACWQINVMAPGAARLLDDTAKDAQGNSIAEGDVQNSGGTGVRVSPNTPTAGQTTYYIGGGQYRCGTVMGKPSGCEYIRIQ